MTVCRIYTRHLPTYVAEIWKISFIYAKKGTVFQRVNVISVNDWRALYLGGTVPRRLVRSTELDRAQLISGPSQRRRRIKTDDTRVSLSSMSTQNERQKLLLLSSRHLVSGDLTWQLTRLTFPTASNTVQNTATACSIK